MPRREKAGVEPALSRCDASSFFTLFHLGS